MWNVCFCLALIFWQCSPTVDTEECVAFWEQKDYMSSGVGFKTAWDVFVRREFWCAPFNLLRLKDEFTLWDHPYPFGTLMGIINSSGKSLQLLKCNLNLICAISMTHEQMRRKDRWQEKVKILNLWLDQNCLLVQAETLGLRFVHF